MVAQAYNSSTQKSKNGCCEFETDLGSIVNARPAKGMTRLSQQQG